ncbi:MAG: NAD-dependent epimerase/dehydratase family protein [Ruminococcus sp.]|nr:NAD-dependent epimerase/dehydratase family protein [Ruminococcus sp.]
MKSLYGSKILITGATGLIGSFYVKCISNLNKTDNANITLYLLVRNREKAEKLFGGLNDENINYVVSDICDLQDVDAELDYIIHGASITTSKMMVTNPVETIDIAINGTKNMLEIARKQKNLKAFLYMSSLEVYGVTDPSLEYIGETDYGYIDQLNVRSSYSLGKRMVECICASYASEYNVPTKIARLTQTFGTGVQYNDVRVFADFSRCVIENRNIILHTKGETVHNYCYLSDAVTGLTTVLVKGNVCEAYNVANESTDISIYDMAQMLCDMYPEKNLSVVVEDNGNAAKLGYPPANKARLATKKIESLGWSATVDLKEMFNRLIQDMIFQTQEGVE